MSRTSNRRQYNTRLIAAHVIPTGLRGRHMRDTGRHGEAETDYLLARCLFPNSRSLYIEAVNLAISRGAALFEPREYGFPQGLAGAMAEQYGGVTGTAFVDPQAISNVSTQGRVAEEESYDAFSTRAGG